MEEEEEVLEEEVMFKGEVGTEERGNALRKVGVFVP